MKSYKDIRRDLHQIPELSFQEIKTQRYLLTHLKNIQTDFMEIATWKTGILVKVKGTNPTKVIGFRADMDGLPIEEETGLPFSSIHKGRMHACGHDFHMTIAIGIIDKFIKKRITDDVVIIFQPAEESIGGALPMIESEEFRHFRPDMIFALHIAPEYPVGTIATKPKILFAYTSELFIDFIGKGGHAAKPHQAKDMIVAASYFITQVQSIVARNIDPVDSGVMTIGKFSAGTMQNSIAETARLEGTIRTLSEQTMDILKNRLENVLEGVAKSFQCQVKLDYGANYFPVINHPALTKDFIKFTKTTKMNFVQCNVKMTGEDFGYMLREMSGFMFWLGVNSPYDLHHAKLQPDEKALEQAVEFVDCYIRYINQRSLL